MRKNIFAFTDVGFNYPSFLSINQEDEHITVMVREANTGISVSILVSAFELDNLRVALNKHFIRNESLELLSSAYQIAERKGQGTHWGRFKASIAKELERYGRKPITARTYRILQGEEE